MNSASDNQNRYDGRISRLDPCPEELLMQASHLTMKQRTLLSCVCSAAASLLSFANPLLIGLLINRAIVFLSLAAVAPVILGMAAVKGARMFLRSVSSTFIRGNPRAPLVVLQRRIGRWLWWLEPVFHSWGAAGLELARLARKLHLPGLLSPQLALGRPGRHITAQLLTSRIASMTFYYLTDTAVTILAGVIFYYTRSYPLSLLAVLLPVAGIIPWFAEKSARIRRWNKNTR